MRTSFGEHLLAGIVLFAAILALTGIPNSTELIPAALFFTVGAVMPDVDSPSSKPRRFMRKVVLLLTLFLLLLFYPQLSASCEMLAGGSACMYLPILSILLVLAAVFLLDLLIPRHRGFLHSFSAALLYGLAVCLLMLQTGAANPFRIGTWAFGGYLSHLLVDAAGDAIPFK